VDCGKTGVLMGAALIFVAYEGFELIPNAINDMENPARDLGRGILMSILITTVIYILVSLVAVGNLLPSDISKYKEYALASAINATLFGTARLGMVMAQDSELPAVFSHRERTKDIPYVSLMVITAITLLFVNTTDLTIISSFASSAFLLIFAAINLSAIRLKARIGINIAAPLAGLLMSLASWAVLLVYIYRTDLKCLAWIGTIYLCVIISELCFSERKLFFKARA
jgi:amino acid transporter